MAKRGVFFQFYLNPQNPHEQNIIAWLNSIPRWYRSRRVKDMLRLGIQAQSYLQPPAKPDSVALDAALAAKKLFSSIRQRSVTES
jgi:hypothetical protein